MRSGFILSDRAQKFLRFFKIILNNFRRSKRRKEKIFKTWTTTMYTVWKGETNLAIDTPLSLQAQDLFCIFLDFWALILQLCPDLTFLENWLPHLGRIVTLLVWNTVAEYFRNMDLLHFVKALFNFLQLSLYSSLFL